MADPKNSLHSRESTLADMLSELRTRLGFVAQGSASRNNEAILKSFLTDAVAFVWGQIDHDPEKRIARIALQKGEALYDLHDDEEDKNIEPTSVLRLLIADGENRYSLMRGIPEPLRAEADTGIPDHWDMQAGQIELYPAPDETGAYDLVIEYEDDGYRFSRPSDRCPVPSRLALLCALASAKAHYHQQDAQSIAAIFQTMLTDYRGRQRNGLTFNARKCKPHGWYVTRGADGVDRGRFF